MQKIQLGTSDLHVTPICLGTMTFGEQVNEADSHAILSRSLERGRSYHRSGHVSRLARGRDGRLVAWVQGTHRYATGVEIDRAGGGLDSRCSCPVGQRCKHAVAVVLGYLDAL